MTRRQHGRGCSRALVVVRAALIALLLGGCQSQPPVSPRAAIATSATQSNQTSTSSGAAVYGGGTVTVAMAAEPPTLDPEGSASAGTFFITASVAESLLYLDDHHQVKPWLAESWQVEDGGATFTFKLRHDVTFQDGTPFNASAVRWNFDRVVDPHFKAGGASDRLFGYQGTDVLDDYTARVRFAHPFVPFLVYVGTPQLALLSPTATAAAGDGVNQAPVGSGPYRVREWQPRDHLTLDRWEGYSRRAPWSNHDGPGLPATVVWKFVPEPARSTS